MPQIITNHRHDPLLRKAYYRFMDEVFSGVDFLRWFNHGHWNEAYAPHSIMDGDRMIANASAMRMNVWVENTLVPAVQIGAVGTVEDYRYQGLSRLLMEHVLDKFAHQAELIFLFANESVIDFYPRFGFQRAREVVFVATRDLPSPKYSARKLHLANAADVAIARELIAERDDPTRLFGASDFGHITWFYILNGFHQRLHYLEDEQILFILSENDGVVHIWDAIARAPFDMSEILPRLLPCEQPQSVHYYFSPDRLPFAYDSVAEPEDSYLYVRGRFPLENQRFKFPFTAQT
ncbi:GNAT family N-acetyltransferase [candidate division GN15 bacterium]|nr:GNAT family N-acetyltransferase [candidate division GN15 bacterium]